MTRRETPLRAGEILAALAREQVDAVVIGGLAVQAHGHTRTTQDVDLFPAPDSGNLARLAAALRSLDARQHSGQPVDASQLARPKTLSLESRAGGIDIRPSPPGAGPYEDVRRRALEIEVGGVQVAIAGKDDLIAMKRAAGRPIDRGDVIALTAGEADDDGLRATGPE